MRPPLARPCGKRSRESPTVRAVFWWGRQNMQTESQCVCRRANPARSLHSPSLPAPTLWRQQDLCLP